LFNLPKLEKYGREIGGKLSAKSTEIGTFTVSIDTSFVPKEKALMTRLM